MGNEWGHGGFLEQGDPSSNPKIIYLGQAVCSGLAVLGLRKGKSAIFECFMVELDKMDLKLMDACQLLIRINGGKRGDFQKGRGEICENDRLRSML